MITLALFMKPSYHHNKKKLKKLWSKCFASHPGIILVKLKREIFIYFSSILANMLPFHHQWDIVILGFKRHSTGNNFNNNDDHDDDNDNNIGWNLPQNAEIVMNFYIYHIYSTISQAIFTQIKTKVNYNQIITKSFWKKNFPGHGNLLNQDVSSYAGWLISKYEIWKSASCPCQRFLIGNNRDADRMWLQINRTRQFAATNLLEKDEQVLFWCKGWWNGGASISGTSGRML